MKISFIFFVAMLAAGCASPPKPVAQAWSRYRAVKVGMTWQQVQALLGPPKPAQPIVGGPYHENWTTGDLSRWDRYGAWLMVYYDGVPGNGRVERIVRTLHRPDITEVRPKGPVPPGGR